MCAQCGSTILATWPVPVVDNPYPYPYGAVPDPRRRFLPKITLGRVNPTVPHLAKAPSKIAKSSITQPSIRQQLCLHSTHYCNTSPWKLRNHEIHLRSNTRCRTAQTWIYWNRNNSVMSCSISLKCGIEFDHIGADTLQAVLRSQRHNLSPVKQCQERMGSPSSNVVKIISERSAACDTCSRLLGQIDPK